jgi:glycosyltransferase involved in cell wall biosynthesis
MHRRIWQRLPRTWRRQALFAFTRCFAPRLGVKPERNAEPIYIIGALRTASGLGESARMSLEALRMAGRDAWGIDVGTLLMQEDARHDYQFAEAGAAEGPGTMILYVSAPLMALVMLRLGARRLRGKTVIGYWAWELPDIPKDWHPGYRYVHEIWVPSEFTAAAIARHTQLPVRVVPYPVPPPSDRVIHSYPGKRALTVLTVFNIASSFARKNPLAAIEAFQRAFGDDPNWRLIVKASNIAAYPIGWQQVRNLASRVRNIVLLDDLLSGAAMTRLIVECDILLSLHRSEGFGLTLAEAMYYGKAVVATNWSGNIDFLTPENSCPVAYHLVSACDPQGTYDYPDQLWAEPDIEDAARKLRLLASGDLRQRLGQRARRDAEALFSCERYNHRVAAHLGLPAADDPPAAAPKRVNWEQN